jgi:hypothetical protein
MKTNLIRVFAALAIGLIVACVSAIPAAAQDAVKGSFTLPNDVRWQNASLPAGDYTFSLKSTATPAQIVLHGDNGPAMVMTSVISDRRDGRQSFLIVEHRGGSRFVRELYLAEVGLHLRYNVPSIPKHERELAQGPVTTEQVLVAMNTTQQAHN